VENSLWKRMWTFLKTDCGMNEHTEQKENGYIMPAFFFCFTSLPCEKWAEHINAGSLVSSFNNLKNVKSHVTKVFSIKC